MLYLSAAARHTTTILRRAAWTAGYIAAGLTAAAVGLHTLGDIAHGPGALYAAIGISAVVAAALVSAIGARSLAATMLAEMDRLGETQTQLVAEVARIRARVPDHHEDTLGLDRRSIAAARAIAAKLLDN